MTDENGIVISADPTPQEIAGAVRCLMEDAPRLARLRAGSKAKWRREYFAIQNYGNFAAATVS